MSSHDETVVADAELFELFRPHRPDADEFDAGIAARITARIAAKERKGATTEGGASTEPGTTWRDEFTRRVASFLPLDPLTGTLGLASVAKLATTTLVLPLVVVIASVGAFFAAVRSVRRSTSAAVPARVEPDVKRTRHEVFQQGKIFFALIYLVGFLVVCFPLVLRSPIAIDAQLAVFLTGTIALVVLVRGLSASGLMTPKTVSRFSASILYGIFFCSFIWRQGVADADSDLGDGWATTVILVGVALSGILGNPRSMWRVLGFVVGVGVLIFATNSLRLTRSSPSALQADFARLGLELNNPSSWEAAAEFHEALIGVGAEVPQRADIGRMLDEALAESAEVDSQVWACAARMGAMTIPRWNRLAENPRKNRQLDELVDGEDRLQLRDDAYLVEMLLATRTLTVAQRDRLLDRIDKSWSAIRGFDPLGEALLCVRLFDLLRAPERIEALRRDVDTSLLGCWTNPSDTSFAGEAGGFGRSPASGSRGEPTYSAVALMSRFGVPEGIDIRAVRAYLRSETSEAHLPIHTDGPGRRATERAALLRVEGELGIPPRPWFEALLGERKLLAALLIVILCVIAIRMAPPVEKRVTRVTLP